MYSFPNTYFQILENICFCQENEKFLLKISIGLKYTRINDLKFLIQNNINLLNVK